MKNIVLFLVAFIFITACSKEKINQNALSNPAVLTANKIFVTPKYRGLYVDNFDAILGDATKEDSLLTWCKRNKFTSISLYDLGTIFQNPTINNPKLAHFIKRAKTIFKIKQVAAVRGTASDFLQTINLYNITRSDTVERFNVLNLENEWWNNGPACDFSCYTNHLTAMNAIAQSANPALISEEYIGWFQNPAGQEIQQANTLILNSDRILVHDYRTAPDFNYLKSRLSFLGKAALSQGKTIDIIVIFSAENAFMFNYFDVAQQNKTFDNAYADIVAQYNATSFAGKNNIRIIGYQIFDFTEAHRARPV